MAAEWALRMHSDARCWCDLFSFLCFSLSIPSIISYIMTDQQSRTTKCGITHGAVQVLQSSEDICAKVSSAIVPTAS
jgi:hypothetical protein